MYGGRRGGLVYRPFLLPISESVSGYLLLKNTTIMSFPPSYSVPAFLPSRGPDILGEWKSVQTRSKQASTMCASDPFPGRRGQGDTHFPALPTPTLRLYFSFLFHGECVLYFILRHGRV